jgi:hypothetical protein
MVIFVPPGDESVPTRVPAFYDDTYKSLLAWAWLKSDRSVFDPAFDRGCLEHSGAARFVR